MALSSKVLTARRALALIGAQANIESFSEDRPEAALSELFYDQSLEELLSEFDWTFARKFQKLSESTTAPTNSWSFRYNLPADLLVIRSQVTPGGRKQSSPPGQMEAVGTVPTFMTDQEQLEISYTAKIDTGIPYFKKAHTFLLASYLADSFIADLERSQFMLQRYDQALNKAMAVDASQEVHDSPKDASWIESR